MAAYEALMFEILPHVQHCPAPSVLASIRSEARNFFQEAQCWIHNIDETTTIGLRQLTINDLPADTRIVVPLELFLDSEPLQTANHRMMRIQYGEQYLEKRCKPKFAMLSDHSINRFDLFLLPDKEYPVTGRIAIAPTRTANEIPDAIMDEFADGLIYASLAKLLNMRNTEWYDAPAAMKHMQMARMAIEDAKSKSRKENTSRIMVAQYGGI